MISHPLLRECVALALAATLLASAPVASREPGVAAADAARPASPRERGELIGGFIRRWGSHVESTYGIDVRIWAQRMVPTFAFGDATNLRRAAANPSFEAALRDLTGVGHRASAGRLGTTLARTAPGTRAAAMPDIGKALGDLTQDLVFTPVTPCRIVDTRIAGGAIGAGQTRNFAATAQSSYASQGGDAGNCGLLTTGLTAVALNVTAVTPEGAGYAAVFQYNSTRPGTSSVNYAAGDIVNNAIISRIPNPIEAFDFSLFTYASSHYVVDIVGYFAPPRASTLQCVDTSYATVTVNSGLVGQVTAPACPFGYTSVHLDCESSSGFMPIVTSSLKSGGVCSARNNISGASATLSAARRCCRVPGR
jgi:hypothetical protein